jgi:hypothetical protein
MDIYERIQAAIAFISQGSADRVDGEGFKVYKAGTIIRVDIEEDAV